MKFFKKSKRPNIPGELIKDYGLVNEYRRGLVRFKHNVLLVKEGSQKKIIIKEDATLIGGEIRILQFDKQGASRLKEALDNALRSM